MGGTAALDGQKV